MTAFVVALTVLTALVALVWLSRHLMIWRENRKGFQLTGEYPGPPPGAGKVSVVVAAKDEAENIERCIRTMLDQDYADFEMIVCDDRSTDGTAEIVERVAAEDPRVRLVRITHLPEGWCGKNNAMQNGIAQATGEWIVMIDADCHQVSRRTLSVALQYAVDSQADMLSILPELEMRGFWENLVQPVCSGVMLIWFSPDKVNSPRRRNAYANGAFMMMRRETYQRIGTHEAFKDRLNEDMHMADHVKRSGLKLRVVRGLDLYFVRMYTSLTAILRGWSRIFFGTFVTMRRLTASLVLMFMMGLWPYLAAVLGLALSAGGVGPQPAWLTLGIVGVAASAMQVSVIARYFRLVGGKAALAPLYVLGVLLTLYAICKAIGKLRAGATVTWRNTRYSQNPS